MPRLPRDCSFKAVIKLLENYGYAISRQTGSHIRLSSKQYEHSITIPAHKPLKIGTLNSILNEISTHSGIEKAVLIEKLNSLE
jgi:predicted RNA binding protein YcfA (HicA-like mRNA interferase family)